MPGKKTSTESAGVMKITDGWDPRLLFRINQHAIECWARGGSALREEMTQFVHARMQEDMGTWARLTICRDPIEAFECQRHYAEKAATDYFDEAGKLSRLAMSIATESVSALQGEERAATSSQEARAA